MKRRGQTDPVTPGGGLERQTENLSRNRDEIVKLFFRIIYLTSVPAQTVVQIRNNQVNTITQNH